MRVLVRRILAACALAALAAASDAYAQQRIP